MAESIVNTISHIYLSQGMERGVHLAIDVGAHLGEFSKELVDSELFGRVIAFEPNPNNADILERLQADKRSFRVVRHALGSNVGFGSFYCDDDTATGSLLEYHAGYKSRGAVTDVIVPITTLDEYLAQEGNGSSVGLIKIDAQGNDLGVLEGSARVLKQDRPFIICELIHIPLYMNQCLPELIFNFLEAFEYKLYTIFNIHVTKEGGLAYVDALFIPKEISVTQSQQYFQIDNLASLQERIERLEIICEERLQLIHMLDTKLKMGALNRLFSISFIKRIVKWGR